MRISVVTVAFNAAATLGDALQSVARQQGVEAEHWVVDGGSTDGTAELVRRSGPHLAGFVSEPDRGLYDAMNKGLRLATGEVVAFLNADDWYAGPEVLSWVAQAFEAGGDVVYGDLDFVSPEPPYRVRRIWRDHARSPDDFFRRGWHPAHPVTFVRRSLLLEEGGFDLRWRIAADYALLARVMRRRPLRLRHLPRTLVNMRLGGASTAGLTAVFRGNRECAVALAEVGVRVPWATLAFKLARKVGQLRVPEGGRPGQAVWRPWVGDPG